jgi:SAM-dependent methyltransferase
MALFKNAYDSHQHSLEVLDAIYGYDSFLDGISTIADMGCGQGLDTHWWATLETRDDPPEPRNFLVYAVDQDISKIEPHVLENKNVIPFTGDFEAKILPRKVDLIWSHDSFQYAKNPIKCLANWKNTLHVNGMLVMMIPQTTYLKNNRLQIETHHGQYYNYNILNLIYLLAISGFDCNDAYFYRKENSPWLYAAVYASEHDPMPDHTSWYELAEKKLINDYVVASVNNHGHARLDDVVVRWLDRGLYQITN